MIKILLAILLSICSNLDNLMIGLNYGTDNKKVPIWYSITIGFVISFVTFIAVYFGEFISKIIPGFWVNFLGAISLIIIGIIGILNINKNNEKIKSEEKNISLKNGIILGLILSINNFAISMAGGLNKVNDIYLIIGNGIFSILFLKIGIILGKKISSKLILTVTSVILILMGLFEYFF